jgi:hypothetical protein
MATLNWCYHAKGPDIENAVNDAIYAAHKYRNRLCELELEKRKRHYDLLRELAPRFVELEKSIELEEAELGKCREAIQQERVKQRTKSPAGVKHWVDRANQSKEALKQMRAGMKEAKLEAYSDPAVKAAMEANTEQHKEECKQAKGESGLYWGTEAIVKMACASFASGAPPRFKRFDGQGQLAVQLQGGLDCADSAHFNGLCYLGEQDGKRREVFFRIGSDEKRCPIFARVKIVFHRPLPEGKIKWAYLERRKIADHVRWTLRLTIDVEEKPVDRLPGVVAIHTGWRSASPGLRVATVMGSDGQRGTLKLSADHCADYDRLDKIRSERDQKFNAMILRLREWLKDREIPDWMAEIRPHLHAWKSQQRLASLWWQWKEDRFDGDDSIFNELGEWRKADKHQWQHYSRLSVRIIRRRKDIYRNFVSDLSKRYGIAIVSPIDAKDLTENSSPEDLDADPTVAHRQAKWAAVSELTQMIREKFRTDCIDVDSKNITRQCSNCGEIAEENKRRIQCRGCGHTHDCDDNAVANTMARGEVAMKDGALLANVAAEELAAKKRVEKLLKMQEARRASRVAKLASAELAGK